MSTPTFRYPGTHSFTAAQQLQFFGREREAKELFRLLALHPVVVLFGKSGIGKTSLLQAGLSPLLEELQLQPVKLRLNDTSHSISHQLWEQFNDGEYLPLGTPDNLSLLEYCRRFDHTVRGATMAPLLLLDQFEELFTLYSELPAQREDFIDQLTELLADSRQGARAARDSGPVRVIISIRSDFLYLLDRLSARIPAILRCRYELSPLDEDNARLAITAPAALGGDFASAPFTYSPAALSVIIDSLRAQSDGGEKSREVEAFLLQQFCQHIERKLVEEQAPAGFEVGEAFFGGKEGIDAIRDTFYAEVLAKCPPAVRQAVQRLVEEKLISDGRRIIAERETVKRELGLTDEELLLLCRERLVREEPRGGSLYYELSHDTLLAPVLKAKEKRLKEEEMAELRRKAEEERQLAARAQAQAEQERALKLEAESQRAQAERNERRAAKQTRLAVMVSLLALVLAGFAGWFYFVADKAKQKAEDARGAAVGAQKEAEAAKRAAEANLAEAKKQEQKAIAATREAEKNFAAAQANLRRAEQEEKRARAALAQVEKEKEATEAQRRLAEGNFMRAQVATEEAKAERDRAQRALEDLAGANTAVVRLLLQNTAKDVLSLNYEQAYGNVQSAAILKAEPTAVAAAALELAFWYGETGDQARADTMLRIAYASLNKRLDTDQALRAAIESADKRVFDGLMMRYYPLDTVRLAGGTFEMGCKPGRDDFEECFDRERLHNQSVRGFIVSRHETTWWQYRLFCEAQKHAYGAPGWGIQGDNPAVNVSWYDAVEYANWVSERLGLDAAYTIDKENVDTNNTSEYDELKWIVIPQEGSKGYRLPTEAEWEYAARGGQEEAFAGYNDASALGDYAWYYENTRSRTEAVKGKKPNAYGLYDMSGNVWEWCWDWYGAYPEENRIDYTGPTTGPLRVIRGGGWFGAPRGCRVAFRGHDLPGDRGNDIGFRLARSSSP